ncbi:unnamed protein product [marine sediment metagenome]|uniref:Uncharacterized protein n=1 Tax=marine sediment metagenome TaxID=412755 RepID=X1JQR6_9ZZZZ
MLKNEKLRKKEYDEMKKIGELAGINDLIAVYGEYNKELKISNEYLKELEPKIILSTTNNTI